MGIRTTVISGIGFELISDELEECAMRHYKDKRDCIDHSDLEEFLDLLCKGTPYRWKDAHEYDDYSEVEYYVLLPTDIPISQLKEAVLE
ncbi:hypothetical protein ADUPG1_000741, partial [Aduncisulcus paluster]